MLKQLKNLVFGLQEYDKTKIEIRFDIVAGMLESIVINEISDFEILEEIIYKIKEELRVRSSNINKTISNPARKFRKKDVLDLLDKLIKIKYHFLKKAFNLIDGEKFIFNSDNLDNLNDSSLGDVSIKSDDLNDKINLENIDINENLSNEDLEMNLSREKEVIIPDKIYEKKLNRNITPFKNSKDINVEDHINPIFEDLNISSDLNHILILEKRDYIIKLYNTKLPYIMIDFKKIINYKLIKRISSVFFETYAMHGSNIIQNENKVLILSRIQNDNLFELPRIDVNLDELFNKFSKIDVKKFVDDNINLIETNVMDIDIVNKDSIAQKNNISKKLIKNTHDNSLKKEREDDIKLEEIEKKKKLLSEEMNKNDGFLKISPNARPKIKESLKEKEDSLDALLNSIDKTKKDLKPEVKFNDDSDNLEFIKETEVIKIEKKKSEIKKKDLIEVESKSLADIQVEKKDFELYRDEKIFVYLNSNSSVSGEIIVETINRINMALMDTASISYMSIFSKVFSTVIYEVLGAQGTNLIWNFDSSSLQIIPRFENDNVNNLKWENKSNTEDFLDQVRDKLLSEMQKEMNLEKGIINTPNSTENNINNKYDKNNSGKNKNNDGSSDDDSSDLQKKGKFILEQLRKIP